MRPILLKGHERPLTFIKYNREGDLVFTCAKDHHPTLWYSDDGERVGTYIGHNGAVWTCDITGASAVHRDRGAIPPLSSVGAPRPPPARPRSTIPGPPPTPILERSAQPRPKHRVLGPFPGLLPPRSLDATLTSLSPSLASSPQMTPRRS